MSLLEPTMNFSRHGLVLALGFSAAIMAVEVKAADLTAAEVEPAAAAPAKPFEYRCEDGSTLSATFSPPEQVEGTVELVFSDGRRVGLPQAISASGARYEKDGFEFWTKGKDAMLTIAGKTTNCTTSD
jgi:membrane-bound inhibitor of C-type lysozyme